MMRCAQAAQAIQLYIDGQLPPAEASALAVHIASCLACHEEWRLLMEVAAAADALPLVREPAWLTTAIMARIAREQRHQERVARAACRLSLPDAITAAILATFVTALFVVVQTPLRGRLLPLLNAQAVRVARQILPMFMTLMLPGASIPAWMTWLFWGALGLIIALMLAGSEVRTNWRDTVRHWLSQGE